jgi:hypothetical protein
VLDLLAVAAERRQHQQRVRAAIVQAVTRGWSQMAATDLSGSWTSAVGPAVGLAVAAGQYSAASGSTDYVSAVVGDASDPAGVVRPGAFSGTAADGRPLASLLYLPIVTTKMAIARGVDIGQAMSTGLSQLVTIADSEVADAGRIAAGVAVAAEPKVIGYVRTLRGPSCGRCSILAGRLYRWNQGFTRHPRCDCVNLPVTGPQWRRQGGDVTTDPRRAFDALTRPAQDRLWTTAGAQAIRDGADPVRVVNARRGMYEAAGFQLTREGAKRTRRLMPESIYREATSRDDAVRLLRQHGYIT